MLVPNKKKSIISNLKLVAITAMAVTLVGCGTLTGIPSHGGGKRFAIEQRLVSTTIRGAIKEIDLTALRGKTVFLQITSINDQGAGNMVGGRASMIFALQGITESSPITIIKNTFKIFDLSSSSATNSSQSSSGGTTTNTSNWNTTTIDTNSNQTSSSSNAGTNENSSSGTQNGTNTSNTNGSTTNQDTGTNTSSTNSSGSSSGTGSNTNSGTINGTNSSTNNGTSSNTSSGTGSATTNGSGTNTNTSSGTNTSSTNVSGTNTSTSNGTNTNNTSGSNTSTTTNNGSNTGSGTNNTITSTGGTTTTQTGSNGGTNTTTGTSTTNGSGSNTSNGTNTSTNNGTNTGSSTSTGTNSGSNDGSSTNTNTTNSTNTNTNNGTSSNTSNGTNSTTTNSNGTNTNNSNSTNTSNTNGSNTSSNNGTSTSETNGSNEFNSSSNTNGTNTNNTNGSSNTNTNTTQNRDGGSTSTTSNNQNSNNTSKTETTQQVLANQPEETKTRTKGTGYKGNYGVEYRGQGAYQNFNVPVSDVGILQSIVRTYFYLNDVIVTTDPNNPAIEAIVNINIDVFGSIRSRLDTIVYNKETVKVQTVLEVMAIDYRDHTLMMVPQTGSYEAIYDEKYAFWIGPLNRNNKRITHHSMDDPMLVDFKDVAQAKVERDRVAALKPREPNNNFETGGAIPKEENNQQSMLAIQQSLTGWLKAWENSNVADYLSHYSPSFVPPQGMSVERWKKHRSDKLTANQNIKVRLKEVQVLINPAQNGAKVTFLQEYQSSSYQDEQIKSLVLENVDGSWRIVSEVGLKK